MLGDGNKMHEVEQSYLCSKKQTWNETSYFNFYTEKKLTLSSQSQSELSGWKKEKRH